MLRRLGRGDEAIAVAMFRKELWPGDGQRLFTVAEELAQSARLLQGKNEDGYERATNQVFDVLQQAIAAGCQLPADRTLSESFGELKKDPRFAKLISRN